MTDTENNAIKISMRIDPWVYSAIGTEARAKNRETTEHIQRILFEYALSIDPTNPETIAKKKEDKMLWDLVYRVVQEARNICASEGQIRSDITFAAIQSCMEDKDGWATDYETYVQDNPYKHGNPRKGKINKEIGFRIREALESKVLKKPNGKPETVPVKGSIIQTYTPMKKEKYPK